MLRRRIAAISISVFYPLATIAHSGDHVEMTAITTSLHHAVLPITILSVIVAGIMIRANWRTSRIKTTINSRDFERPRD